MVRCPMCARSIQAVTPKDRKTGRFFIECPDCRRNISLSLEREKDDLDLNISQALVAVKEEKQLKGDRARSIGKNRDAGPRGEIITRQRRIRTFRRVQPMSTPDENYAVVMELEDGPLIGTDERDEGMGRTGENGAEYDIGNKEKGVKRRDEGSARRYRSLSASLFFLTFVLGIVYLFTTTVYSPVTVNPNENYTGEHVDIMGIVYGNDENSSGLDNAIVVIKESNHRANTNDFGYFFFEDIEEGTYTLTATKKGFGTQSKTIIVSGKSAGSVINFQLGSEDTDETRGASSFDLFGDKQYNSYFSIVLFSSLCALAAGIFTLFSRRIYPAAILGLFGIASVGFIFGSICAFGGVIFHISSKRKQAG